MDHASPGKRLAGGLAVDNIYYNQPMLVNIPRAFHVDAHEAGLVATFTQIGYAAGMPLFIRLGNIVERRQLVVALFAASAAAVLAGLAMRAALPCVKPARPARYGDLMRSLARIGSDEAVAGVADGGAAVRGVQRLLDDAGLPPRGAAVSVWQRHSGVVRAGRRDGPRGSWSCSMRGFRARRWSQPRMLM